MLFLALQSGLRVDFGLLRLFYRRGILLGSDIGQSLLVVFQLGDHIRQLCLPCGRPFLLAVQLLQLGKLALQGLPLSLCLGKKTGPVIAALVFQILQPLCQPVPGAAFITGGDQIV